MEVRKIFLHILITDKLIGIKFSDNINDALMMMHSINSLQNALILFFSKHVYSFFSF